MRRKVRVGLLAFVLLGGMFAERAQADIIECSHEACNSWCQGQGQAGGVMHYCYYGGGPNGEDMAFCFCWY